MRTYKYKDSIQNENTVVVKKIIDTAQLNGKKVKFSGYLRSGNAGVKLLIKYSGNGHDYKTHEILVESNEWKKYELILTIPKGTIDVIYGREVPGRAEVWADDFEFSVNNSMKWQYVDASNMGFECGKIDNTIRPVIDWEVFMVHHKVEVSDKNPYSGNFCLKINYTGRMFDSMPQFGETTKASIGNNLICVVPLTLLTNGSSTYPQA